MPQFSHIAGDPILDLLNTVEWRLKGPDREEDLTTFDLVVRWCAESHLLDGAEQRRLTELAASDPAHAEAERIAVVGLREHAYALLFDGDVTAAAALADAYRDALAGAELRHDGGTWRWAEPAVTLSTPRHRIARGLVAFLGRDDLDRLHQCEDEHCGWVYLDTSPRRNRRWCVTKDCGDRNRARAYYARQKAKQNRP